MHHFRPLRKNKTAFCSDFSAQRSDMVAPGGPATPPVVCLHTTPTAYGHGQSQEGGILPTNCMDCDILLEPIKHRTYLPLYGRCGVCGWVRSLLDGDLREERWW